MFHNSRASAIKVDRKNPPPQGWFPVYYIPSSRTRRKRTPLEEPGASRGVLFLPVLGASRGSSSSGFFESRVFIEN